MRAVLFVLFSCILSVSLRAQVIDVDYKSYKKAQQHFTEALNLKAKKQTDKAIAYMETALKEYPSYIEAYSLLGEWYFEVQQYDNAVNTFRTATHRCRDCDKTFAKPLARALVKAGKADSALLIISKYAPANADEEWKRMGTQALFIQQSMDNSWMKDPWLDTAHNMGIRINSSAPELYPSTTIDTQTFYFTRRVNDQDEDFYYAHPDTCGGWYTARNMGGPLNTSDQESAQAISTDGHYLFFTRCGVQSENGWDQGDCDLFMAYRPSEDSPWSIPQNFGATINTPNYEGMPCLSPDNRELYFVSNRKGGYGGFDIWVSKFEEGLWQAPVNLGPTINTPGNETAPFICLDNHTIYFSSNGLPGMGGYDIFQAKRTGDTTWSAATNLGYPINTTVDDKTACVTADGQTIFFASDRDSVAGNYDIYEMPLPQPLQPLPVSYLIGYVFDSISNQKLNNANIYINDSDGHPMYQFQSNRGDGSYNIILPEGRYTYQAVRIGYTETSGGFQFTSNHLHDPYIYNIPMVPSDYVKPITDSLILTIHFQRNGTTLNDTDIARIRQAMDPWMLEKGLLFMVNGYTDNTGTPLINEQLSYLRANLVAKQLMSMGINELSIKPQGWGEAKTIAPNDNEEGQTQNRRVEIVIQR